MVKKAVALVFLLVVVLGMAHWIEIGARPDSGKQGVEVHGEHEH
jgi:hypothetical protein